MRRLKGEGKEEDRPGNRGLKSSMVLGPLSSLFASSGACSGYWETGMNTDKMTKESLLRSSNGLTVQHGQHPRSQSPAASVASSENTWWPTHPGPGAPLNTLRGLLGQMPPLRPFPLRTPEVSSQGGPQWLLCRATEYRPKSVDFSPGVSWWNALMREG